MSVWHINNNEQGLFPDYDVMSWKEESQFSSDTASVNDLPRPLAEPEMANVTAE
jgi:hypothetical protein